MEPLHRIQILADTSLRVTATYFTSIFFSRKYHPSFNSFVSSAKDIESFISLARRPYPLSLRIR
jgi:hypothetical protein